jgi:hypothetical protein
MSDDEKNTKSASTLISERIAELGDWRRRSQRFELS